MSKFRNCFISKLPNYQYDITIEGETIAKAHLLTAGDHAYIEDDSSKKTYFDGQVNIDISSQRMISATIERALVSWTLSEPLSRKAIDDLTAEARSLLFSAIQEHEKEVTESAEDAEKN